MNNHEFDLALADFATTRVQPTAPPMLRQRIRQMALPSTTERGWLPPSITLRSWSLFDATKLLVAAAIVALFGGFLLAGVVTQPTDRPVPAAPSPEASPRATDVVLARLETEEVAPGVLKVAADGTGQEMSSIEGIIVSDDGTVWTWTPGSVRELGQQGHRGSIAGDLALGPGGTLWAAGKDSCADVLPPISSFDGQSWTLRSEGLEAPVSGPDPRWPPDYIPSLAVGGDGVAWAVGENCGDIGYTSLLRLGPEGWTIYSIGDGLPAWPCGPDCGGQWSIETTPDGTVWLGVPQGGLARFDGSGWNVVRPLGGDEDHGVISLASNGDGVLWAEIQTDDTVPWYESRLGKERLLARFDGQVWEVFPYLPASDTDDLGPRSIQAVGPDGAVWLTDAYSAQDRGRAIIDLDLSDVRGLSLPVSFDGERWSRYPEVLADWASDPLNGFVVSDKKESSFDTYDIALGPDATAWVTVSAARFDVQRRGLYVITPEPVAATE